MSQTAPTPLQTKRIRSCVACGTSERKNALLRIVRSQDGSVSFDKTGKAAGRGAYVCGPECFESLPLGKLEHALRAKISPELHARLSEQIRECC